MPDSRAYLKETVMRDEVRTVGRVSVQEQMMKAHLRTLLGDGLTTMAKLFVNFSGQTEFHERRHLSEECFPCAQRETAENEIIQLMWDNRERIVDQVSGTPDFSHHRHTLFK